MCCKQVCGESQLLVQFFHTLKVRFEDFKLFFDEWLSYYNKPIFCCFHFHSITFFGAEKDSLAQKHSQKEKDDATSRFFVSKEKSDASTAGGSSGIKFRTGVTSSSSTTAHNTTGSMIAAQQQLQLDPQQQLRLGGQHNNNQHNGTQSTNIGVHHQQHKYNANSMQNTNNINNMGPTISASAASADPHQSKFYNFSHLPPNHSSAQHQTPQHQTSNINTTCSGHNKNINMNQQFQQNTTTISGIQLMKHGGNNNGNIGTIQKFDDILTQYKHQHENNLNNNLHQAGVYNHGNKHNLPSTGSHNINTSTKRGSIGGHNNLSTTQQHNNNSNMFLTGNATIGPNDNLNAPGGSSGVGTNNNINMSNNHNIISSGGPAVAASHEKYILPFDNVPSNINNSSGHQHMNMFSSATTNKNLGPFISSLPQHGGMTSSNSKGGPPAHQQPSSGGFSGFLFSCYEFIHLNLYRINSYLADGGKAQS